GRPRQAAMAATFSAVVREYTSRQPASMSAKRRLFPAGAGSISPPDQKGSASAPSAKTDSVRQRSNQFSRNLTTRRAFLRSALRIPLPLFGTVGETRTAPMPSSRAGIGGFLPAD